MRRQIDYSLYLVTDRALAGGRSLPDLVAAAVRGGVTAVQLREKACSTREFVDLAWQVKDALAPVGVPLFINDRVDVALAVEADGVHVGQSDMDYRDVRRLVDDDVAIGVSVDTPAQAAALATAGVQYLGVGPVFATATKSDTAPPWAVDGLRRLRSESRQQLVAIGGINETNVADVIRAGADGVAVVSAICAAADPEAAARRLREIIDRTRKTMTAR